MNIVIGIDPGPKETAFCVIENGEPKWAEKLLNGEIFSALDTVMESAVFAIESIASYGMPVGRETFETCYMIGALTHHFGTLRGHRYNLYPRPEYMRAICGTKDKSDTRGPDRRLFDSLKLRFGGDKKGEPLHLLKGCSDKRSAFAVAVYHLDITKHKGVK